MPEENKEQEVETTKVVEGKVKWFGNPNNPVPIVMARLGKALRYICTGMIVLVSSAPGFTPEQSTMWSFWLSAGILISGALELLVGVEPSK